MYYPLDSLNYSYRPTSSYVMNRSYVPNVVPTVATTGTLPVTNLYGSTYLNPLVASTLRSSRTLLPTTTVAPTVNTVTNVNLAVSSALRRSGSLT